MHTNTSGVSIEVTQSHPRFLFTPIYLSAHNTGWSFLKNFICQPVLLLLGGSPNFLSPSMLSLGTSNEPLVFGLWRMNMCSLSFYFLHFMSTYLYAPIYVIL